MLSHRDVHRKDSLAAQVRERLGETLGSDNTWRETVLSVLFECGFRIEGPWATMLQNHGENAYGFGVLRAVDARNGDLMKHLLKQGFPLNLSGTRPEAARFIRSTLKERKEHERFFNQMQYSTRPPKLLSQCFHDTYRRILDAAQQSSTDFVDVAATLSGPLRTWHIGIAAMKKVRCGKPPSSLPDIIALLSIASSMAQTIDFYREASFVSWFKKDLPRWTSVFKTLDMDAKRSFVEAAGLIWEVDVSAVALFPHANSNNSLCPNVEYKEAVYSLGILTSALVRETCTLLNEWDDGYGHWDTLAESQRKWMERTRGSHDLSPSPRLVQPEPPDKATALKVNTGSLCGMAQTSEAQLASYLMMSAAFAVIFLFLLVLRQGITSHWWSLTTFQSGSHPEGSSPNASDWRCFWQNINQTSLTLAAYFGLEVTDVVTDLPQPTHFSTPQPSPGERLKCSQCPMTFGSTTNVNRHQREQHDKRRFRCERCGAPFPRKDYIKGTHKCSAASMRRARRQI
jgi:hypothetical protein